MNRRQKLKKLKRDNKLMHDIINNSSEMKELYRAYNEPIKNVVHTSMRFQEYRGQRFLTHDMYDPLYVDVCKKELERTLFEAIKENIKFRIDDSEYPYIEASLYVGIKGADQ